MTTTEASTQAFADERWLPVVGWEGLYEVSDLGHVKSVDRVVTRCDGTTHHVAERILKQAFNNGGYFTVGLARNGHVSTTCVHRLVLEAFVGPRPPGEESCHLSSVKTDNRLINLLWDTHEANVHDQLIAGTQHAARKTHCPQGHPYSQENTYKLPNGGRVCRECQRAGARSRYAANRDAINARRFKRRRQRRENAA